MWSHLATQMAPLVIVVMPDSLLGRRSLPTEAP